MPTTVHIERLSEENELSVGRTIERMSQLARADSSDPVVSSIARSLSGGTARDYVGRVHHWVRHNVRFVQDVDLAAPLAEVLGGESVSEVLIRPRELVRMPAPQGDCDDFSMVTLALLHAGGIPASFATVAANPAAPLDYSHVYVVAHLPDGDVPVDSSHGARAGWEAPNVLNRLKRWGVGMGLGCCGADEYGLGEIDWGAIIQAGITSGTQIVQGVLQKPVYQSGGPNGTTIYSGQVPTVAPAGSVVGAQILPGVDNSTLLLGGLGLVAVLALMGGRRR